MTFKQLRLFDGEITVTGEPAWIIFLLSKKTISRRKAFRHPYTLLILWPSYLWRGVLVTLDRASNKNI